MSSKETTLIQFHGRESGAAGSDWPSFEPGQVIMIAKIAGTGDGGDQLSNTGVEEKLTDRNRSRIRRGVRPHQNCRRDHGPSPPKFRLARIIDIIETSIQVSDCSLKLSHPVK